MLQKLIEHMVKSLVDQPESVVITQTVDGNKVLLKIAVSDADVGRVIGKEGQTIRAMRSLALVLGPIDQETIVEVAR